MMMKSVKKRFRFHRSLLAAFLILCTLGSVSCGETETESGTVPVRADEETTAITKKEKFNMKIMSFNVWSKNDQNMTVANTVKTADARVATRASHFNDLLRGEEIDIAGLQELTDEWRTWLKTNLDCAYAYVGMYTRDTGEAGYILYQKEKFEVLESGHFWLAEGAPTTATVGWDAKFDRLCAWAIFRVRTSGEVFAVFDTHLDHEGATARPKQAETITAQMKEIRANAERKYGVTSLPTFLTGDMNSEPGSEVAGIYKNASLRDSRIYSTGKTEEDDLSTSPGLTHCRSDADFDRSGHIIDYIWTTRNVTVTNYHMIHTATDLCPYGSYISDHNAIVAEVRF